MSNLEGKQKQIATYEPNITAVLCVDHYNDFLSEGGKLWPLVKDVAEEVNLLDNLRNPSCARHASSNIPPPFSMCLITAWSRATTVNRAYPSPYQLQGSKNSILPKALGRYVP